MSTYEQLDKFLGKRDRKNMGGVATRAYRYENGTIAVRYHDTDVVTVHPDGRVVLDSGGWRTATTKERMNRVLVGWTVYQDKGIWFLTLLPHGQGQTWIFDDGITIMPDGTVTGGGDGEQQADLRKRIRKYVKDYMDALFKGEVPAPSGGDCWYCYFQQANGKPLGEGRTDHLDNHMEDQYYVPSLLVNAVRANENRVSQVARWALSDLWSGANEWADWREVASKQLSAALKKYLYAQYNLVR